MKISSQTYLIRSNQYKNVLYLQKISCVRKSSQTYLTTPISTAQASLTLLLLSLFKGKGSVLRLDKFPRPIVNSIHIFLGHFLCPILDLGAPGSAQCLRCIKANLIFVTGITREQYIIVNNVLWRNWTHKSYIFSSLLHFGLEIVHF